MFKDEVSAAARVERRNLVAAVHARTCDLRRRLKRIICSLSLGACVSACVRARACDASTSVCNDKGVKHAADFANFSIKVFPTYWQKGSQRSPAIRLLQH